MTTPPEPGLPPGAPPDGPRAPSGVLLMLVVVAMAAWVAEALAAHPGFQPVYTLRTVAPVLGLMCGAAFTHQVARARRRVDVEGEFNPGSRALFLGAVMLVVTLLAWLVVSQAMPGTVTAMVGVPAAEPGNVAQKVALAEDPACRWRLEVTSASIARAMDECVDRPLWTRAANGSAVTLDLMRSALGAEIVAVRP